MAPQESPRRLALYFAMAQVGFEMVAPIILGVVLDNWLETSPWFVALGAVLGLVGGLYHLVVLLNRLNKPEPPSENGP